MSSNKEKAPVAATNEASDVTVNQKATDMKSIAKTSFPTSIVISDIKIHMDSEGRYSLNDLHTASGKSDKNKPANWLRAEKTVELIDEILNAHIRAFKHDGVVKVEIPTFNPVVSKKGRYGGTYVCKELVYSYAMWISAAFALKVIRAYDALVSGNIDVMVKPRQTTATQLTPLRQTVERLITTGLGRIYPDIWKLVHHRFEVEHINQLTKSQVTEAIEYLDALEGEYISKHQSEERWCNAKELNFKLEMIDRIWQSAKEDIAKFDPNMSKYLDGSMNMLAMYSSSLKGKGICSDSKQLKKVAR